MKRETRKEPLPKIPVTGGHIADIYEGIREPISRLRLDKKFNFDAEADFALGQLANRIWEGIEKMFEQTDTANARQKGRKR